MSIQARSISKTFGATRVLEDVSLEVEAGRLVALLGPSGSGKTTFLRILSGLDHPDSGSGPILFDGEDVSDWSLRERRIGFVFQHYALFGHLSVFENVAFGLRVRPRRLRPRESEIRRRVLELLELVQLAPLAERRPAQLSGGQRQRVALARALAIEPRVLLLDEPFGALDARVRTELRGWLRRLHEELHVTSVFVTHDQEEALEVADAVVVMNHGRVEQVGAPEDVYREPASEFVASFLGAANRLEGRVEAGRLRLGPWSLPCERAASPRPGPVRVYLRPHELELRPQPAELSAPARVLRLRASGAVVRGELRLLDGTTLAIELPRERLDELRLAEGDIVHVTPRAWRMFA